MVPGRHGAQTSTRAPALRGSPAASFRQALPVACARPNCLKPFQFGNRRGSVGYRSLTMTDELGAGRPLQSATSRFPASLCAPNDPLSSCPQMLARGSARAVPFWPAELRPSAFTLVEPAAAVNSRAGRIAPRVRCVGAACGQPQPAARRRRQAARTEPACSSGTACSP